MAETALRIESLYDGLPQDIEWAYCKGTLHLLQSRPITNLPVQPIELSWEFENWSINKKTARGREHAGKHFRTDPN